MKKFLIVLVLICFSSCKEKKTEFVQSVANENILLVKNPKQTTEFKQELIMYVKEKYSNNMNWSLEIYTYDTNTEHYINTKQDFTGGFSFDEIWQFQDESGIGKFYYESCENDTLKKVGIIRYYEKYGNFYEPDTIIKCK